MIFGCVLVNSVLSVVIDIGFLSEVIKMGRGFNFVWSKDLVNWLIGFNFVFCISVL